MNKTIIAAKKLALEYHAHHRRPNASDEPCIIHLAEVASYVADHSQDASLIAAAWLHDLLEDTTATPQDIESHVSAEVSVLVGWLTDPADWKTLPLVQRKAFQVQRIREAPLGARLVKLADQISNIRSVLLDPPSDWTPQKCSDYIQGAHSVAQACEGVAPQLDRVLAWYCGDAL